MQTRRRQRHDLICRSFVYRFELGQQITRSQQKPQVFDILDCGCYPDLRQSGIEVATFDQRGHFGRPWALA